jgi:proline iminopeptidase
MMFLLGTGITVAALVTVPFAHRTWRQWRGTKALAIKNPRGIVEERFVQIGGLEQWISIRGEDRANPVLLVVHGGPGFSYGMFTPIMRAWEKQFTVVQWDQRGAGRTFARHRRECGELSVDRLTADGIEVAAYIRSHLVTDELILVGSSFGSLIALRMAKARPELFAAYVGTDQNVGMGRANEYQATLNWLRALGRKKGVTVLEKLGPDHSRWSAADWSTVAKWTMTSDPATNPTRTLLGPSMWFAPGMSLRDLKQSNDAMKFSAERLYREFPTADAWSLGTQYDMPFFVFQGEGDVMTPPTQAAEYFDAVKAPVKKMTLIESAGHFAMLTQPQQFLNLLLTHVRPQLQSETDSGRAVDTGVDFRRQASGYPHTGKNS